MLDENTKTIRKVTWVGLIANILLSAIKFVSGIFGKSHAMVADAVHSLSDSSTDIAILIGSNYWSQPPDDDHPYGHQRIETVVTIFIGLLLTSVAIGIGWDAVSSLRLKHSEKPELIALIGAIISIISKEILYRWTAVEGKRVKSMALVANAWHHRSDALSSVPALLAVGGAMIFPSWTFLDLIGALVVSIFILQAAIKITLPRVKELVDVSAPKEMKERILSIAEKTENVLEAHKLRTRYLGSQLQIDIHVVVDSEITVLAGHDIADLVTNRVLTKCKEVIDVVVHIEPDVGAHKKKKPEDKVTAET